MLSIILFLFLITNRTNFVYLLADPGFLSAPLNFYEASAHCSHYRMDAPGIHSGQSDKQTNRRVSLSACVSDGVWHLLHEIPRAKRSKWFHSNKKVENADKLTILLLRRLAYRQMSR